MNNMVKYGIAGVTGAFVGAASLMGALLYSYVAEPDFVARQDFEKAMQPRNAAECVMKNKDLAVISEKVEVKTAADGNTYCMYTPTNDSLKNVSAPTAR